MVTISQLIDEQPHDPSARLTLSVENLAFIRLLQYTTLLSRDSAQVQN